MERVSILAKPAFPFMQRSAVFCLGCIMGLARRRNDQQRMKAKARRVYPHDKAAKAANHLKVCSCHMCGNPRRYWPGEKTMQERKAELRLTEGFGG